MNNVTTWLPLLQFALTVCNLIAMGCVFVKFLNKPHDTLEQRVAVLETKVDDLEKKNDKTEERNNDQDRGLEVITKSVLALIEFEMQYCITENKPVTRGLEKAKDALNDYLAEQ